MAVACVWSAAGVPQEATAGILLGRKKFLRALRAGTGRSRQSGPLPALLEALLGFSALTAGSSGQVSGSYLVVIRGPQGTAATVGCCQGLLLQGEWPVWGSQVAPDLAGQRLQQVYPEMAGAPSSPGWAAGVCTQRRRPVQGLGAGLGG